MECKEEREEGKVARGVEGTQRDEGKVESVDVAV